MTRPVGYHRLAADDFDGQATHYARMLERTTSPGQRRWLVRAIARSRARAEWHAAQHRAGAQVPPIVAKLAAQARHSLACARATSGDERRKWIARFRRDMRSAGYELAATLLSSECDRKHGASDAQRKNAALRDAAFEGYMIEECCDRTQLS